MELYQKINEIMGQFAPSTYSHFNDYIYYKDDVEIQWHELNNRMFIPFLQMLDKNVEWKRIMYKKPIPENMLDIYSDYFDWKFLSAFQGFDERQIDKYSDKLDWTIISSLKHTMMFFEKHEDKVDFQQLSISQNIPERFIEKYKDKVSWIDICMYQFLSEEFIDKHLDYLTKECWINISKFQHLSKIFIIKHADDLDWNIMSVYQDLASMDIFDTYNERFDWNMISMYQPMTHDIIMKYMNNLSLHFLCQNPGITLTSEELIKCDQSKKFFIGNIDDIMSHQELPEEFIQYCIDNNYNDILRWTRFDENGYPHGKKCISAQNLSKGFIEKYQDKIYWPLLPYNSMSQCDFELLYKEREFISDTNWRNLSGDSCVGTRNGFEDFLEKVSDYVSWDLICMYQTLSEDFIDKHKDTLYWDDISRQRYISEEFAIKHKNYMNWTNYIISHSGLVTEDILLHCINNIDLEYVLESVRIEFSLKMLKKLKKICKNERNLNIINVFIESKMQNKENSKSSFQILKDAVKEIISKNK